MRFTPRVSEEATLGLTPLIDVVLLLLIFFLVTTTFAERRLEVELPKAEAATAGGGPQPSQVELAPDGTLRFGGRSGSLEALERHWSTTPPGDAGIELRADRATAHGQVVQVLDLARTLGITRVGVVTTPPGS